MRLELHPNLKLVAIMGVGYEGIQVDRLHHRGVQVTNAPGASARDVADQAMALLLGLMRRVMDNDSRVRRGGWVDLTSITRVPSLYRRKVGILGMGAIGKMLARRFDAFECEVSWFGPRPQPELAYRRADTLLDLARDCEVLVLAHRADHTNAGIISAEILDALGSDGILVNVSRGSAVDEDELIDRLRDGRIAGAALDVFEPEPVLDGRWNTVPNCVLSPHVGGVGMGTWAEIGRNVSSNLDRFFAGESLISPLHSGEKS